MADVLRFNAERTARRTDKSERAKAGRKKIAEWLQHLEQNIRAGILIDFDGRFGRELTCYPSAVLEGRSWASQQRLAKALSKSARTIYSSLNRLKSSGVLIVERRGRGRTNRYIFCVNGQPVFPNAQSDDRKHDRKKTSDLDRKPASDHDCFDRKPASDESSKPTESLKFESPPNPPSPTPSPDDSGQDASVLNGEVLGPEGETTFDEFWNALRDRPGPTGPALAVWRKLNADDRRAIGNKIGPHGLDLDGMWAVTWLTDRRWEREPLRRRSSFGDLSGFAAVLSRGPVLQAKPYSSEWNAERERMIAAGESVKLMDTWAAQGKPWGYRPSDGGAVDG